MSWRLGILLIVGVTLHAAQQCGSIRDSDRLRLIEYLSKKYNLPGGSNLTLRDVSYVADTCYRRLEFRADKVGDPILFRLVASPDLRFLFPDVLDVNTSRGRQQAEDRVELIRELVSGVHPSRGRPDAPVIVTVFSDFQCPYCAQLARKWDSVLPEGESKRVRLVFRYFPLSLNSWSKEAAKAGSCAFDQGNEYFWTLHDYVFEHQRELTAQEVGQRLKEELNKTPGFDLKRFDACITSAQAGSKVEDDEAVARNIGVTATPTIFVNDQRVIGFYPVEIRSLVEQVLKTPVKGTPGMVPGGR